MELPDDLGLQALDSLPLNVAVLNTEGKILATNDAWKEFARTNGLESSPSSVGTNYLTVCDGQDDDPYAQAAADGIRSLLAGEDTQFKLEYPCHSPDEKRWFLLHASSIETDDARYCVTAHANITERKVGEITVERRNRELTAFAGLLAHKLRNPLAIALGWVEDLPEPASTHLRETLAEFERIIDDTLAFLRVGSSKQAKETVSVAAIATEAWEELATGSNSLAIDKDATVRTDPALLKQVFDHLFQQCLTHGESQRTLRVNSTSSDFYLDDPALELDAHGTSTLYELGYVSTDLDPGVSGPLIEKLIAEQGWELAVNELNSNGTRFTVTTKPTLPTERLFQSAGTESA